MIGSIEALSRRQDRSNAIILMAPGTETTIFGRLFKLKRFVLGARDLDLDLDVDVDWYLDRHARENKQSQWQRQIDKRRDRQRSLKDYKRSVDRCGWVDVDVNV